MNFSPLLNSIIKMEPEPVYDTFSKYERTRVISCRAHQLENGATSTINTDGFTDALEIAIEEYEQGKIPLIVVRTFPNGKKQYVKAYTANKK